MDDQVSEEKNIMMASEVDQQTDHLFYNSNSLQVSSEYLEKYRQWVMKSRKANDGIMEKIMAQVDILASKFGQIAPEVEQEIDFTLKWLHRKIGWTPTKEAPNVGYASYEDMFLRYRDLKKELDNMKTINKQVAKEFPRIVQEHKHMCQMNDKLDEIRFRYKLIDVAQAVAARATSKNDPLFPILFLPIALSTIVYDDDTANSAASKLLNILKRLLALSEALQYEKNPKNVPIVTLSNILEHPPQSAVKSLYVQMAETNGEVLAPEEKILPVARDSAHTLLASENGETIATAEINIPIAKDSVTTMESKESPKPLTKPDMVAGQSVSAINSQKNG